MLAERNRPGRAASLQGGSVAVTAASAVAVVAKVRGTGESSSIQQPVGFESLALDFAAEVLSSPLASAGSASGKAYSARSEPLSCSWRRHSGPPSRTTSNAFASALSDNLIQPPPLPLPAAMPARRAGGLGRHLEQEGEAGKGGEVAVGAERRQPLRRRTASAALHCAPAAATT
ncbi:unnamed protein product [Closterium sp. Yama58-4]|nr:unnamed protein product [Closterium sp. Yama58-4]